MNEKRPLYKRTLIEKWCVQKHAVIHYISRQYILSLSKKIKVYNDAKIMEHCCNVNNIQWYKVFICSKKLTPTNSEIEGILLLYDETQTLIESQQ